MFHLLNKCRQTLNREFDKCEQLRVNAENEYLAMSCGAFNPRLLAKIKRSKAGSK